MRPDRWVRQFVITLFVINLIGFVGALGAVFRPVQIYDLHGVPQSSLKASQDVNGHIYYQVPASLIEQEVIPALREREGKLAVTSGFSLLLLLLLVCYGRHEERNGTVMKPSESV